MAIRFKEIKQYIARNVQVSICFEDGHYHNYLMISDVPDFKYDNLFVYGVGMVDVEFSRDVYASIPNLNETTVSISDEIFKPAIEIALREKPRDIERTVMEELLFKDLRPYLQGIGSYSIVNREDWSNEAYVDKRDIPKGKYDDMYVYGISMEENPKMDEMLREREYDDSWIKKRMVVVLSKNPREDIMIAEENIMWDKLYNEAIRVQKARTISPFIEAGGVAAAILTKAGNIYVGVCIDTASTLGMCAERNAIANMITNGESQIDKVVAVTPDGKVGSPCGACREYMMQLDKDSGDIEILLDLETKKSIRLKELLPDWWGTTRFAEQDHDRR